MDINPHDQKPEEHAPKPAKKSSVPVATLSIFLLASLAAGAWYVLVYQRVDNNFPPDETPALSSTEHSAATLTPQPEQEPTNPLPEEPLSSVKDTPLQFPPVELAPQQQCDQLSNKLSGFFTHLDQEPYIKDFKLNLPVADHFNQLTVKLLANPPVVTRESDDLYTILTNMAHFFRVIGRQNILLIKGILDRERDKIEDVAAELYTCTIVNKCTGKTFQIQAPLDKVYEYAGFFLNTMGGRSYLFRRDSRSRLLVNYYALLIIDKANQKNINRYGLDIRETIPRLVQEIEATNQLIYKEDYLDKLGELQDKYPDN